MADQTGHLLLTAMSPQLEASVAHLNSHFPLVARDLTQPVWLLSTTLAIISLSGGSQERTDLLWLPQNTCSQLGRWVEGGG